MSGQKKHFFLVDNIVVAVGLGSEIPDGATDASGYGGVALGAVYDPDADTLAPPYAKQHAINRAMLLIIRAAIQEGIIPLSIVPQEAKDIWQEIKDNRL